MVCLLTRAFLDIYHFKDKSDVLCDKLEKNFCTFVFTSLRIKLDLLFFIPFLGIAYNTPCTCIHLSEIYAFSHTFLRPTELLYTFLMQM